MKNINNRFYEKQFSKIFEDPNALREFYEFLDRNNLSDTQIWNRVVELQEVADLEEDTYSFLEMSYEYSSLKDNQDVIKLIANITKNKWNCDLGTWDNIANAFDWLQNYVEPDVNNPELMAIKNALFLTTQRKYGI